MKPKSDTLVRIVKLWPLLIALGTLPWGFAQQSFSPSRIVFSGAPAYKTADLLAAVGFTPGRPLTEQDVDKTVQQLVDSGLFADVHYTIDSRALTFTLIPQSAANMVPVVYANFVLWKPDELTSLLHTKVPLFNGMVPTSGNFQQTVAGALTAVLADRGVNGHVEGMLAPDKTVVYSITEPVVQIHQIHADGVSVIAKSKLIEVLESFDSTRYDRYSEGAMMRRIHDAYLDLGFLDVAVDDPVRAPPVVQPSAILLDYTITVHEGGQYRIAKVEWPVTPVVPQSDFEHDIDLRPGANASHAELLTAVERTQVEFTRRGYLDVAVTVRPAKNPEAHTVEYAFFAEPFDQYHLHSVQAVAFTEQQKIDFDKNWKLGPGAIYDSTYATTFFQRYANLPSFQGYAPKFEVNKDRDTHLADLVITMAKRSASPGH